MRFHLIDQIISLKKWTSASAIKNITNGQDYFLETDSTFLNSLLLETIFQTAAWLVVISSDQKYRPTIISFEEYEVYTTAMVGDQLLINVAIERIDETNISIEGKIYSNEKIVAEINYALLHLLETSDLEDKKETKLYLDFLLREMKGDHNEY